MDAAPLSISRGQARAAARALNRLAEESPQIDPDQLRRAFRAAGLDMGNAPPAMPARPPSRDPPPPADTNPTGGADAQGPPPTGPPEPIWVRPRVGARLAGVGTTLFYRWIQAEKVVSKRVCGVRLVYVPSIHRIAADPPAPSERAGARDRGRYAPKSLTQT